MISLRNRINQLGFSFRIVLNNSLCLVACITHVNGFFARHLGIIDVLISYDRDAFKFMEVGFFEVLGIAFFFGSSRSESRGLFDFGAFVCFDGPC